MDAELAELTDELSSDPQLTGVRSVDTPALLTFESAALTVELEVRPTATGRRLIGQLVPPSRGEVVVRHRGGTSTVAADEVGRFTVDDLPAGPASLRCSAGSALVETDWFLV